MDNEPANEREQRGLVIAATANITKRGSETWIVPSQTLKGKYAVTITSEGKECTCPDFELRQQPCKHIFAVQYVLFREQVTETTPDGTVTTTTTEAAKVHVTYGQPSWSAYNKAQTTEKEHFLHLLRDLVSNVPTPPQIGAGRRFVPMPDMIFAAAYKIYGGFSGRRFMTDMRQAQEQGLVSHAPCYNSIFNALGNEEMTPILHDLIAASAKPLASLESQFAIDSTGIGTQSFYRHYSAKYGHDQMNHDNVKLHACIGTKTNVVTAARVTDRNVQDCEPMPALIHDTAKDFFVCEMTGDKAYLTVKNLETMTHLGISPFIPFKTNSVGTSRSKVWNKLFHFFQMNREEFMVHYHRRSNAEATFSMIKRVIGDTLRSKTPIAQINEALLMVVCHNLRCLIHEMFELGVMPTLEVLCPTIQGATLAIENVSHQSPVFAN